MPKVSVIIPVYGVENYIERCARSLFEQTLDEIEYLFINDCTQDNSIDVLKKVLKEYPSRQSQVIIHHMDKNSGQAVVRQWGMTHARGEYIIHCDSDDWVSFEMYEKMLDFAKDKNYDIVYCDYYSSDGTNKNRVIQKTKSVLLQGPVWNKIVKRSIYTNNDIIL